jgi:hypothetical protein
LIETNPEDNHCTLITEPPSMFADPDKQKQRLYLKNGKAIKD